MLRDISLDDKSIIEKIKEQCDLSQNFQLIGFSAEYCTDGCISSQKETVIAT
jgi:hypothetical protein